MSLRKLAASAILAASLLPATAALADDPTAEFSCADGSRFTAVFTPPGAAEGSVVLTYADGHKVTLPQAMSADGGRYVEGETEFWIKGNGGTLTIGDKATTCEAKP